MSCICCVFCAAQCWGYNNKGQLGYAHTNSIGDNTGEMGDNMAIVNLGTSFVIKEVLSGNWYRCVMSMADASRYFCILVHCGVIVFCCIMLGSVSVITDMASSVVATP